MPQLTTLVRSLGFRRTLIVGCSHVWTSISARITTCWYAFVLYLWGAEVGTGFRMFGKLNLHVVGALRIGQNVRMRSGKTNFVGIGRPMSIWVGKDGVLDVHDGCAISNTTIVCQRRIDIREGTFIGGGCQIFDNDFHQLHAECRETNAGKVQSAPVAIGPRAFVGASCIVLKGVVIGESAVIGAGSVVTRDVPAFEIWAGAPAKCIGQLARP